MKLCKHFRSIIKKKSQILKVESVADSATEVSLVVHKNGSYYLWLLVIEKIPLFCILEWLMLKTKSNP